MKIRPARGMGLTVYEAVALSRTVSTWAELLSELNGFWVEPTEDNVRVQWYCDDRRIGWDTWLVTVDGRAALFTDGLLPDTPVANILPCPRGD